MQIRTESPCGATVLDHDVAATSEDDIAVLRGLLGTHGVLVFPDQDVDDTGFLAFLTAFGDPMFTPGETPVPGHPDLNVISNVGRTTTPRSVFHTDTSYVPTPPAYTALVAKQVPARGGQTLFADQYSAYDAMPAALHAKLAGRTITHAAGAIDNGVEARADHPAFLQHPVSGRTAVYVSTPARCVAVSGMDDEQSAELIGALYEHCTRDEFVLRHSWRAGDVVMWDNRCVLHRADHSEVIGDRVMHRGMVCDRATPGDHS
ncbi:TauD/TfdA family dioxygenase [Williamsia sp. CHRR-6]|uniref:TauD/TfdA dioxygenase family protein n=1 Tax=Williamsia sp. CHRR-6 TaxID=2835871 RepID=UPI001BDB0027|nr:TauD/TfdA family dioxygenase [Williamsia sp. CHRR-6]MBT0565196.1 TauD/TfdA family dioxygenase [Williamsia sp. CHRR-6]